MVMQVAFNMFIPCMLFTKVASTLSAQPDISLIAIPALALAQVGQAFNALYKWNQNDVLATVPHVRRCMGAGVHCAKHPHCCVGLAISCSPWQLLR